jgi:hypothetical protein
MRAFALSTALALTAPAAAALAQAPVTPEAVATAKAIQTSCIKRGEDSRVCACSVGLAYAQLDPRVFKLVPQVEPLLDEKNQAAAAGQLLSLAMANGLGVGDLQAAYTTIRANRETVRQICRPLGPRKPG